MARSNGLNPRYGPRLFLAAADCRRQSSLYVLLTCGRLCPFRLLLAVLFLPAVGNVFFPSAVGCALSPPAAGNALFVPAVGDALSCSFAFSRASRGTLLVMSFSSASTCCLWNWTAGCRRAGAAYSITRVGLSDVTAQVSEPRIRSLETRQTLRTL